MKPDLRSRPGKVRRRDRPAPRETGRPRAPSWAGAAVWAVAAALCVAAYSGGLRGRFVYDDQIEIVQNRFIQEPRLYGRALLSDVWAFKGERDEAWSNYWRPVFVGWMMLNYQLFGLEPMGWHITSLAGHIVVCWLAWAAARGMGLGRAVAAISCWLFAAHPVHVESVCWPSAIPDILMSGFVLGSFLSVLRALKGGRRRSWAVAMALYALALLSKEAAIVYPALVLAWVWLARRGDGRTPREAVRSALAACVPFVVVAAAFVAARYGVLGKMRSFAPGAAGVGGMLATLPAVATFYVRQAVLPLTLGPMSGLRPVAVPGVWDFYVPLAAWMAAGAAAWWLAARRPAFRAGLLWFVLPILLALDTRVFLPEQIAQNRYLYLPLLGAAMMAADLLSAVARPFAEGRPAAAGSAAVWAIGGLLCLALVIQCRRYAPVWGDETALWQRGVEVDPRSAYAHAQLGEAHRKAGRVAEARASLQRSLELNPDVTPARLGLAALALSEGKPSEARGMLEPVLRAFPDHAAARERLALALQKEGRIEEAIAVLDEGRRVAPFRRGRFILNIALLHAAAGRTARAMDELESIRDLAITPVDAALYSVWFYLGELYRGAGRKDEALAAYDTFLSLTRGGGPADPRGLRGQAAAARAALAGG